eukprot:g71512.t1
MSTAILRYDIIKNLLNPSLEPSPIQVSSVKLIGHVVSNWSLRRVAHSRQKQKKNQTIIRVTLTLLGVLCPVSVIALVWTAMYNQAPSSELATPLSSPLSPLSSPLSPSFLSVSEQTSYSDEGMDTDSNRVTGKTKDSKKDASPKYKNRPRVRREIRSLSPKELETYARAVWTMKNLSTAQGRALYGPNFNNHDDILYLHSCSTMDPRCDQGHYGPQFMTFHRAMLLKWELSLLSIAPSLGAMPYWDISLDSTTGKFYGTENFIFSDKYFGDYYGNQKENGTVTNGLFAYWPIVEWTK